MPVIRLAAAISATDWGTQVTCLYYSCKGDWENEPLPTESRQMKTGSHLGHANYCLKPNALCFLMPCCKAAASRKGFDASYHLLSPMNGEKVVWKSLAFQVKHLPSGRSSDIQSLDSLILITCVFRRRHNTVQDRTPFHLTWFSSISSQMREGLHLDHKNML